MEEDGVQLPIIAVNLVTVNVPYSTNELDIVCEETRKDPTIKILMHYISTGWPCECRRLHKNFIHIGILGKTYLLKMDL